MSSKKLISIALFLIPFFIYAQKDPVKWGKVDKADLEMTFYEQDSSAEALVLVDYGNLEFDLSQETGVRYLFYYHKQIKILKKSALDRGDISIGYYKDDKILELKAQIHLPDGEVIKLKNKDFFDEETSEKWNRKKFSFPNVTEGCVLEFKYTLRSELIFELESWYFQEDIPVRWSEYRLEIPQYYKYIELTQGRKLDISESNSRLETTRVPRMDYNSPGGGGVQKGYETASIEVFNHRFVMHDVPAMKEEKFITTMNDYRARIQFQLQTVVYPSGKRIPILSDWKRVCKEMLEGQSFGLQFKNKSKFKKLLNAVGPTMEAASGTKEKAQIAYEYISKSINWDEKYSIWAKDNLNDCFEKSQANSGELNLMLMALLRHYQIDAYPVLVSTRSHGKMTQIYPIISQFNHFLVLAKIDGNNMLLDAGNPRRPMGVLRSESLNKTGLIVDAVNPQWIDIIPDRASSLTMVKGTMTPEGYLSANYRTRERSYSAVFTRDQIAAHENYDFMKENFSDDLPDIEIEAITTKNEENAYEALECQFDFKLPNSAISGGDMLYFQPVLFPPFDENPFKVEKREYPVEINFPFEDRYVMELQLPEGYVVEEFPEAISMSLPEKGGQYQLSFKTIPGNKILINSYLVITQLEFQPEEYASLKNFFDFMIEKQEEQIVLRMSGE